MSGKKNTLNPTALCLLCRREPVVCAAHFAEAVEKNRALAEQVDQLFIQAMTAWTHVVELKTLLLDLRHSGDV